MKNKRLLSLSRNTKVWMITKMMIILEMMSAGMNMMVMMMLDLEVSVSSMFFLEVWMIPKPCQLWRKPWKYFIFIS